MKKISWLFLLFSCLCINGFAEKNLLLFNEENKSDMQLLDAGKKQYCIAGNTIYCIEKNKLEKKTAFLFTCNDAAVYKGDIVLATSNGIQLFNTKTNSFTTILPQKITGNINHIQTDAANHIWFTKEFEGCYMINDDSEVAQKIKVPVTYSLAYTNDSTMWVGTNVGLYKVPISGKEIERYAEEGIASNDLPDNLVERLFTDTKSNVWAIMPGHISFIPSHDESEFPDYEFSGGKDNDLYQIAEAPAGEKTYLLSTSQGIIFMPGIKNTDAMHTGEIHQAINENAYLLSDEMIEKPLPLKGERIKLIKTCGANIYFVTNKGLWSISSTKFTHRLKKRYAV